MHGWDVGSGSPGVARVDVNPSSFVRSSLRSAGPLRVLHVGLSLVNLSIVSCIVSSIALGLVGVLEVPSCSHQRPRTSPPCPYRPTVPVIDKTGTATATSSFSTSSRPPHGRDAAQLAAAQSVAVDLSGLRRRRRRYHHALQLVDGWRTVPGHVAAAAH